MSNVIPYFKEVGKSLGIAFLFVVAQTAPSRAQEMVAGPFEKLFTSQLGAIEIVIIILASVTTIAIATREFANGQVTVMDVPTMPKYTVPRLTFWSFCLLYVAIVFALFVVVMERYELLRQILIDQNASFEALPSGADVLTISIGSVAVVVVLHYLKIPNTQIGPSWLLFMLRCGLHKRARIPEEAQTLASEFLSDNPAVFAVPENRIQEVLDCLKVKSVAAADFGASPKSVDYQWAVVSYFYAAGLHIETVPPYSSFISNSASLWLEIVKNYDDLAARVAVTKIGGGDEVMQRDVRQKVDALRLKLSIFHACLHLFACSDDASRAEKLKEMGLRSQAIFFVLDSNTLAKFGLAIVAGIAVPPLAFGAYALITGSPEYAAFAQPALIGRWIVYGAPMYLLPIAMVMVMKRLMRTSWPIRAVCASVGKGSSRQHRADFKWDIYILIFVLSLGIAAIPLLIYNRFENGSASLWFALAPAFTAASLAVLIDFDVVDYGKPTSRRKFRPGVVVARATGFAVLLGGIVSWLTATISDQPVPTLVVYAVTAAFIGIMIGTRTDFDRNIRVVRAFRGAEESAGD